MTVWCNRRRVSPLVWAVMAGLAQAQTGADPWPAVEGSAPSAQRLKDWHCTQQIDLPVPGQQVATCRRTDPQAPAELHLLVVDSHATGSPRLRDLARLRDANQARLHLFSSPSACPGNPGNAACLAALLLVDQRDESSCYGTQVVVVPAGRPAHAIGFVNEVRGGADAGACIGPWATVVSGSGGALLQLPAPLMLAGRQAALQPMSAAEVQYRITGAKPSLRRQVLATPGPASAQ